MPTGYIHVGGDEAAHHNMSAQPSKLALQLNKAIAWEGVVARLRAALADFIRSARPQ